MANPFVKGWKYFLALFNQKIDQHADPKIQLQQAIEESQRTHRALVQQAAAVIGNQRQLEMKLSRTMGEAEKLQSATRQAVVMADQATALGDAEKAAKYEQSAIAFSTQLVAAEHSLQDLKQLHDQAINAAAQARKAVDSNAVIVQQKLAERTKLLGQLEQAQMQETIASSLESLSALTSGNGNTPTLDEVRDRIESRYAIATGRSELASNSVEARMMEVQQASINAEGMDRLAQIRQSLQSGEQKKEISDK